MSRQSPLPNDRVEANIDQRQRAADARDQREQQERHLRDQGVDNRPGTDDADDGPPDE